MNTATKRKGIVIASNNNTRNVFLSTVVTRIGTRRGFTISNNGSLTIQRDVVVVTADIYPG